MAFVDELKGISDQNPTKKEFPEHGSVDGAKEYAIYKVEEAKKDLQWCVTNRKKKSKGLKHYYEAWISDYIHLSHNVSNPAAEDRNYGKIAIRNAKTYFPSWDCVELYLDTVDSLLSKEGLPCIFTYEGMKGITTDVREIKFKKCSKFKKSLYKNLKCMWKYKKRDLKRGTPIDVEHIYVIKIRVPCNSVGDLK